MAKRAKMVEARHCGLVASRGAWFCGPRHSQHLAKPWRWNNLGRTNGTLSTVILPLGAVAE